MVKTKLVSKKVKAKDLMEEIYQLKEENKRLKLNQDSLNRAKQNAIDYNTQLLRKTKLLELQEDRLLEVRQERNKFKRELNRREYNKTVLTAIILAKEDNFCYGFLSSKEKHYYREYADIYLKLNGYHYNPEILKKFGNEIPTDNKNFLNIKDFLISIGYDKNNQIISINKNTDIFKELNKSDLNFVKSMLKDYLNQLNYL
jgi:hypothetical protein